MLKKYFNIFLNNLFQKFNEYHYTNTQKDFFVSWPINIKMRVLSLFYSKNVLGFTRKLHDDLAAASGLKSYRYQGMGIGIGIGIGIGYT
jgi:hypothetical protein